MLRNHSKFDKKNDEFILMIPADGSSDTADIIWGGDAPMMNARSNVEERSKDTFLRSKKIAILSIEHAEKNRDKQSCTEHTTAEKCKSKDQSLHLYPS